MTDLEKMIWREVQRQVKNPRLRLKDLLEWSSGDVEPGPGETRVVVHVAGTAFNCCIPSSTDKR